MSRKSRKVVRFMCTDPAMHEVPIEIEVWVHDTQGSNWHPSRTNGVADWQHVEGYDADPEDFHLIFTWQCRVCKKPVAGRFDNVYEVVSRLGQKVVGSIDIDLAQLRLGLELVNKERKRKQV